MRKTLTAGLTAFSLILGTVAPVQADTNDGLNKAMLGLLAIGAIGLAVKHNQNDEPQVVEVQHAPRFGEPQQTHRNNQQSRNARRADPLPARCFRQIELGNGRTQSVFTERCLDQRYDDNAALPRQCLTNLGGRDGHNQGYVASCLRDRGFRSDQRW